MFQEILNNLESFVTKVKNEPIEQLDEIQTAIVLAGDKIKYIFRVFSQLNAFWNNRITGVNVSDHKEMFQRIVSKLEVKTKHIAVLWSRESNNIKDITEKSIYQLINNREVYYNLI